ncbi:MAG: hypothetical protein CMH57_15910 [Myxococcales bacterium]|nr:hypothetical protein [Myxococcales bacterium]
MRRHLLTATLLLALTLPATAMAQDADWTPISTDRARHTAELDLRADGLELRDLKRMERPVVLDAAQLQVRLDALERKVAALSDDRRGDRRRGRDLSAIDAELKRLQRTVQRAEAITSYRADRANRTTPKLKKRPKLKRDVPNRNKLKPIRLRHLSRPELASATQTLKRLHLHQRAELLPTLVHSRLVSTDQLTELVTLLPRDKRLGALTTLYPQVSDPEHLHRAMDLLYPDERVQLSRWINRQAAADHHNHGRRPTQRTQAEFDELLSVLKQAWPDQRMEVLGALLQHNRFTSAQALAIAKTFYIDQRVDALARVYPSVTDPANFHVVYGSLYSNDVAELVRRTQNTHPRHARR